MRCFECGEHIPFWGEQCPVCGEDKTQMHATRLLGAACVVSFFIFGGRTMR